jgi:quercetin dioxygenase-like cupin family protein
MGGHDSSRGDGDSGTTGDASAYFDVNGTGRAPAGAAEPSITHIDDLASYEIAKGLFFRPLYAERISLNFVTFPPQSGFPAHAHAEEQISIVREGEMEITVGDICRKVHPGDVVVYPANVSHSGRTLDEGCRLIDIFSPPRTGIQDVIAAADPIRGADVDRWWYSEA